MENGIKKFRELLFSDEEFRQKLKAASEAYTGEQNEEAFFNGVLVPLAEEYGISASYEDFHSFVTGDEAMDEEELAQVAGGGKGVGAAGCWIIGLGLGISADDDGHMADYCIGIGAGGSSACMGKGVDVGLGIEDKL